MPREHTLYSRRVVCVSISNRNTMDSRVCVCVRCALSVFHAACVYWIQLQWLVFFIPNENKCQFYCLLNNNNKMNVFAYNNNKTATRQCQHVVEYTMHMLHSSRLNANYGVWCATMWFPTESDALILSLSDFSTIFNIFNSWPICGGRQMKIRITFALG